VSFIKPTPAERLEAVLGYMSAGYKPVDLKVGNQWLIEELEDVRALERKIYTMPGVLQRLDLKDNRITLTTLDDRGLLIDAADLPYPTLKP
jgi:hypothetical protein